MGEEFTVAVFIGVDGGGTKTEALAVDETGKLLGAAKGGPSNPEWIGFDKARETLSALIEQVLCQSKINGSQVDYIYLGMAGVNSDEPDNPIRLLFIDTLGKLGIAPSRITVDNDAFVGMASAIGSGPGVGVVAGTGFTTVGKGIDGGKHWVPWYVAGRGAGHIIGQMAAKAAYFDLTGAGPKTSITGKVLDLLKLKTLRDLEEWLSHWRGSAEVGRITPVVSAAAEEGDSLAIDMLATAGMEFGLAAVLVARKAGLGADGSLCRIAAIGGGFKAGDRGTGPMKKGIERSGINAEIVRPGYMPVGGAVLLAWDKAGIISDAHRMESLRETMSGL
jgi:glucosamine kinase